MKPAPIAADDLDASNRVLRDDYLGLQSMHP